MSVKMEPYPEPYIDTPGFNGVAFNFYKTINEAIACQDAVKLNLARLDKTVYDYGAHRPGNIHKVSDLDPNQAIRNLYKICIVA